MHFWESTRNLILMLRSPVSLLSATVSPPVVEGKGRLKWSQAQKDQIAEAVKRGARTPADVKAMLGGKWQKVHASALRAQISRYLMDSVVGKSKQPVSGQTYLSCRRWITAG